MIVAYKYVNQVNTEEGDLLKRKGGDDEEQMSIKC